MKLIRTFHPVGHGAFYTERFFDGSGKCIFTAVFDCGCFEAAKKGVNHHLNHINTTIQNTFNANDVIDVLFISHFHTDHINGIDFLLKHCDIKRIYIPILTPRVILEAFLFNCIQTGSTDNIGNELIEKFATSQIPNVTQIRSNRTNQKDIQLKEVEITLNHNRFLSSHSRLCHSNISWTFIPFNLLEGQMNKLLYKRSPLKGLVRNRQVDFVKLHNFITSNSISQLQQIYKQALKVEHNSYSMTVLSYYSQYNPKNTQYQIWWNNNIIQNISLINCLYMGDFEANANYPKQNTNIDALRSFYSTRWRGIGLLQVPHHGSKHNYDDKLYDVQRLCVISHGDPDKYHHPDICVVNGIRKHHCTPIDVTDKQQSKNDFSYTI